jgi:biopolymer transport protein TolR
LWGFVSVMLAILVWTRFGLPTPPYAGSADWATAEHSSLQPGALKEDAMVITIARDGAVFFRDHRVARVDLANEIREAARNGAEKKVYLLADARAKYGDAMSVLIRVRLAGIEHVSLLTEKPYR